MSSFCWKTLKTCDEVQVTKFSPKTFELETDTDDSLSDTPVLPVFQSLQRNTKVPPVIRKDCGNLFFVLISSENYCRPIFIYSVAYVKCSALTIP
jgi:hypothetical protein